MVEVLPSINCHYGDFAAVESRCEEVNAIFAVAKVPAGERWAHFDVADGAFTFYKSWDEPERLADLKPSFAFEAHLMVEDPRAAAERWLRAGAWRVAVHVETATPEVFAQIAELAHRSGASAVLALNPETPAAAAVPYFGSASRFLILGVHPGLSGQKFLPVVLEKISFLHGELSKAGIKNGKIEVDGGMTLETAHAALAAGANAIVSSSDIFGKPDPEGQYMKFRAL